MFGFVYYGVALIAVVKDNFHKGKLHKKIKERAVQNNQEFYYDYDGKMYSIKDGKQYFNYYQNGHRVIIDKHHNVVKDFDEEINQNKNAIWIEEYNKAKQLAVQNNKLYFLVDVKFDKRSGYYELSTERKFTLNFYGKENRPTFFYMSYISNDGDYPHIEESKLISVIKWELLGGKDETEYDDVHFTLK